MADHLGLYRPAVSEIEAGRRSVRAEELEALAGLFGVEASKFFEPTPAEGAE